MCLSVFGGPCVVVLDGDQEATKEEDYLYVQAKETRGTMNAMASGTQPDYRLVLVIVVYVRVHVKGSSWEP